jgi:hypothetical protein
MLSDKSLDFEDTPSGLPSGLNEKLNYQMRPLSPDKEGTSKEGRELKITDDRDGEPNK